MFQSTGENTTQRGIGVSLAFGLSVLLMAYAIGHISGCHLDPAVSVGLVVAGHLPANQLLAYFVAQVIGGWAIAQLWLFWLAPIVGRLSQALFTLYFRLRANPDKFLYHLRSVARLNRGAAEQGLRKG